MTIAECYVLHVYCDGPACNVEDQTGRSAWRPRASGEFTGLNRAEARRQAKRAGWTLGNVDAALCRRCKHDGATLPQEP